MSILARSVYSYYRQGKAQLLLAIVGMALGVAVVLAVDLANQSATRAFERSLATINGPITHQLLGGPDGIDERLLHDLRRNGESAPATPVVSASVAVNKVGMSLLGIDPITEAELRDGALPATFGLETNSSNEPPDLLTFLTQPGGAVLTQGSAERHGLSVGQTFRVRAGGRWHDALLVGEIAADETLNTIIWVDIATAQEWLGLAGKVSRIDIATDDADYLRWLTETLPPGIELTAAASQSASQLQLSKAFMTNLTAMSFLALLVGVFLVFNSMSFAVMQRRQSFATLRSLGVTRKELLRRVLIESQIIAVIGAGIGVFAGYFLAGFLLQLVAGSINDLYFRIEVTEVEVLPWLVVKTALIALAVAAIAAWIPARAAASSEPRVARLRSASEAAFRQKLPLAAVAGSVLLVCAGGALLASGKSLVAGLVILFAMILAIGLLIPWLLRVLINLAGRLSRIAPVWIQLAIATVRQSLSRSSIAIVALAIAISATVGVTTMVGSFRAAVIEWLDTSLDADIYVAIPGGDISTKLFADIKALTPDAQISAIRRATIATAAGPFRLESVRLGGAAFDRYLLPDQNISATTRELFIAGAGVLVAESYAYENSIATGDVVLLNGTREQRELPVLGIYRSYDVQASHVVMAENIYQFLFNDRKIDGLGITLPNTLNKTEIADEIQSLGARDNTTLIVVRNDMIRERTLEVFDRTFVITHVLYWLAVIVAAIGVFGALMALQLENRPQYALLRTLGITPFGIRGVVLLQALLMGLLSAAFALPIGLLMADILIEIINRRAFGWGMTTIWFPSVVGQALLLGLGAAALASIIPAERVARAWPAHSVRTET